MVKLVSVRRTRLYGPAAWRDWWEYINAFVYLVATIVLLVGCILLLPGRTSAKLGLILVLVALALLVIVNLHDLIAQLAGFDFRLPLLSLDPQLALIEILAPLLQVLGSILFFIGTILLLEVSLQTRSWVLHKTGGLGSFTHMMYETTFSPTRTPLLLEQPPSWSMSFTLCVAAHACRWVGENMMRRRGRIWQTTPSDWSSEVQGCGCLAQFWMCPKCMREWTWGSNSCRRWSLFHSLCPALCFLCAESLVPETFLTHLQWSKCRYYHYFHSHAFCT